MQKFFQHMFFTLPILLSLAIAGTEFQVVWGGFAMEPTIKPKDTVGFQRTPKLMKRGDIVGNVYVKIENRRFFGFRLIAVGGDTISMKKGVITLNGKKLNENYITDYWRTQGEWDISSVQANSEFWNFNDTIKCLDKFGVCKLPKDTVFIVADRRTLGGAVDSRFWGPLSVDSIEGLVTSINGKPVIRPKVFDEFNR